MAAKIEAKAGAKFDVGKVVHVWKVTGVRELRGGPSTSERIDGDHPNIEPDEDLEVTKKIGSTRAIVRRSNPGEGPVEVAIHINHVNSTSSYYALRAAGQPSNKQAKPTVAQAAADLEKAKAAHALALKELQATAAGKEAAATGTARDEAAELMAEAEAEIRAAAELDKLDAEAQELADLEADLAEIELDAESEGEDKDEAAVG